METEHRQHASEPESESGADRRDVLKALGLGLLGLAAGAGPAEATSGIGTIGAAQAQGAGESPMGPQWWPQHICTGGMHRVVREMGPGIHFDQEFTEFDEGKPGSNEVFKSLRAGWPLVCF